MFCVSFGAGEVGGGGRRGVEGNSPSLSCPAWAVSPLAGRAGAGWLRCSPPAACRWPCWVPPCPQPCPLPHPAPPASGSTELPGGAVGRGEGRPGAGRGPPHLTPCRKRARREPPVPVGGRHGVPGPGRPLLLARLPAPG